jgi:hypothetical protein
MNTVEKELSLPDYSPLKWLLGEILLEQGDHFLTDALVHKNERVLTHWSRCISDFKGIVTNPDDARKKISAEFNPQHPERTERDGVLRDLYAEILAVLTLSQSGYKKITPVLQTVQRTVDYEAERDGRSVGIEVKNLREATDVIRVIVEKWWATLVKGSPQRYGFPICVRHSHQGSISQGARSDLLQLLDQLPDRRDPVIQQTLEGGIPIEIVRGDARSADPKFDCAVLAQSITPHQRGNATLTIQSPVTPDDLRFDAADYQQFFLKVLRVVANATPKFFSRTAKKYDRNLLVTRWEIGSPLVDITYISGTKIIIEGLFAQAGLQLELMMFFRDTLEETAGRTRASSSLR